MIYPEKISLDVGNPLEYRIMKTDKLWNINYELEKSLQNYISGLKMMIAAEEKISKHLEFIYEGNSSYEELIKNLNL